MSEPETQSAEENGRRGESSLPELSGQGGGAVAKARRGVLCAKCEHLNPAGRDRCEHCEAHLFITCHACSHRNQRVHSRCSKCGHELHRPLHRRLIKKWLKGKRGSILLQIVLLILGVYGAFKVIVRIAESSP